MVEVALSAFWSVLKLKIHKCPNAEPGGGHWWAGGAQLLPAICVSMDDVLWAFRFIIKRHSAFFFLFCIAVLVDSIQAFQCPSELLTLTIDWILSFSQLFSASGRFYKANHCSFCNGWASTHVELDGLMVCTRNHTNVCPPLFLFSFADKSFPRPVISPQDVEVLRNEEARFHCQFIAVPAPKLEWYHENELLTNKSRFVEILPVTLCFVIVHLTDWKLQLLLIVLNLAG